MKAIRATAMMVGLLVAAASGIAHANLIKNGTFDLDLSEWDQAGTIGTFWDEPSQTAHLGRPGKDGTSIFSQDFQIPSGNDHLKIWFDYQWQVNAPSTPDMFTVELAYNSTGGTVTELLLSESSAPPAAFGSTMSFHAQIALVDLLVSDPNATLRFTLEETVNSPNSSGSRIQLDNISVKVPAPASIALLAVGLLGAGYSRKRRRTVN